MDELSYLSRPPRRTHGPLLADLHALNSQFLGLIISHESVAHAAGLEDRTQQALCRLTDRQLERLATCPYSLFDISFCDAAAWQNAVRQSGRGQTTDDSDRDTSLSSAFVLAALLFTRQLCQHHDGLARLLLGMTEDVVVLLADYDLATLTACAFAERPPLLARLADHPHFWSDLVDFVRDGTRERQLAAHTLGVQHSAARFRR